MTARDFSTPKCEKAVRALNLNLAMHWRTRRTALLFYPLASTEHLSMNKRSPLLGTKIAIWVLITLAAFFAAKLLLHYN